MRFNRMKISRLTQSLRSLQWRLVFIFVLVAIVLMTVAGASLSYFIEASYYDTFEKRIEKGFETWGIKTEPSTTEIKAYFENAGKDAFYIFGITEYKTITIVERENMGVIFSNENSYFQDKKKLMDEMLKSKNFVASLSGKIGNEAELNRIGERTFFDLSYPMNKFIFYFRYDKEEWKGTIQNFYRIIQMSFVIAVIVSLILGIFLARTITHPIVKLMHNARKIASGDFDAVLPVKAEDEIGKLTRSFNFMAVELKKNLSEISSEKNKSETILNNMTDGLIAVNKYGNIIHANQAAKDIIGVSTMVGDFNEFSKLYSLELSHSGTENINIRNKVIRIRVAPIIDDENREEGKIIVLQDITEQHKLEDMRREFVANVSHELRTPLTSIKSYAETLLEGAIEEKETAIDFLKIINMESDRMTRLVKDLLSLSRLDSNQLQLNMGQIVINDLIKASVEKLKIEAKNQKIDIKIQAPKEKFFVLGDSDRLEQVLLNILSNAIKYSTAGGKVQLILEKTEEYVIIRIRDTGMGIPEKDLPRIFERFYRVDKARSREQGGTGLGLAIAKEIVEAHQGQISIKSEIGIGTEVTIKLQCVIQN